VFLCQLTLSAATAASSSTLSSDMEPAAERETKQCLMQKKHELARTSQSASSDNHGREEHGLSSQPVTSSLQSGKKNLHADNLRKPEAHKRRQHKNRHQNKHQRKKNRHASRSFVEKGRKTQKTQKSHKVGDHKLRTHKKKKHKVSTGSLAMGSTEPTDGNGEKTTPTHARKRHQDKHHQPNRDRHKSNRHLSGSLVQKSAKTKKTRKSSKVGNHKSRTHKNHAQHKNDAHKKHRKPSSGNHKLRTHKNHTVPNNDTHKRHHKPPCAILVQTDMEGSKQVKRGPDLHALLPKPILALARQLFKNEEAISKIVEDSVLLDVTYAGVKMSLRMNKADDATRRLGEEGKWFSYDLDTLGELQKNPDDALNMLDVGGNLGVVTIAAFKKHSKNLRVITLEPIPMTYFFLRWNLHINGVPEIDKAALDENSKSPGVFAMNRGSADVDGQDLHFCFDPKSSMNSRMCECKQGEEHCIIVPSVTVDNLAGMFGSEPIAMVKMDCEGCEFKSLPALATPQIAKRVLRLAGELHLPDKSLEDLACRWDHGRLLTKCQHSKKEHPVFEIECDVALDCPA